MTATEYARRSCEIIDRWNANEIDADEYFAQLDHLKAQRDGRLSFISAGATRKR